MSLQIITTAWISTDSIESVWNVERFITIAIWISLVRKNLWGVDSNSIFWFDYHSIENFRNRECGLTSLSDSFTYHLNSNRFDKILHQQNFREKYLIMLQFKIDFARTPIKGFAKCFNKYFVLNRLGTLYVLKF